MGKRPMMPPSKKRGASPMEMVSAWSVMYETIRMELVERGLAPDEAAKTAAYVAATLAKEIEIGNDTRKH